MLKKLWSDDVQFLRYGGWRIWLFFIFDHFYRFTPLITAQKIKILKKLKTCPEISSFYISVPRTMVRWHMVPEIWCLTDVIVISHFWAIFYRFTPLTAQKNQYFEKMRTTLGEIIILHMCTKNYDQMMYGSWDMVRNRRMDGQTDGHKKWHIEVGAPPKKWYKKEAPLK